MICLINGFSVFPNAPYSEAMRRYSSDKPDLRISLELVDVDDLVKDVEFKVLPVRQKMKRPRCRSSAYLAQVKS